MKMIDAANGHGTSSPADSSPLADLLLFVDYCYALG
jgi:hypothetical protein